MGGRGQVAPQAGPRSWEEKVEGGQPASLAGAPAISAFPASSELGGASPGEPGPRLVPRDAETQRGHVGP